MGADFRYRILIGAIALLASLPDAVMAQQPTLRYSRSSPRTAKLVEDSPSELALEGAPEAVGTGLAPGGRKVPKSASARDRGRMVRAASYESFPEEIGVPVRAERITLDESAEAMSSSPDGHGPIGDGGPWGPLGYSRVYGGDPASGCGPDCCLPCLRLDNVELFAGSHGFTGPVNRGSGSFGFHEGINAGIPFVCGLAVQGGYQATQSNFEGTFFTPDDRTQSFVTVGAFRRVDLGLQGGVAIDYLSDQWDCDIQLAQLRGELSWRMPCGHEFGFWFATGLDQSSISARDVQFPVPSAGNDTIVVSDGAFTVEPLDIYAFFYRKQFAFGGEGRAWGGFTDDSRGLLGGNIRLPVSPSLSFTTDFLYVIPAESSQASFTDEAWNVSFNLVWTPCRRGQCGPNYCRPLFDVANNGSFLVRTR